MDRYVIPLVTPTGPFGIEIIPGNELAKRVVVMTPQGFVVVSHLASHLLEREYGPDWMYLTNAKVNALAKAVTTKAQEKYDAGDILERYDGPDLPAPADQPAPKPAARGGRGRHVEA